MQTFLADPSTGLTAQRLQLPGTAPAMDGGGIVSCDLGYVCDAENIGDMRELLFIKFLGNDGIYVIGRKIIDGGKGTGILILKVFRDDERIGILLIAVERLNQIFFSDGIAMSFLAVISAAKTSVGISEPHYAFQLTDAIEEMEHITRRIKSYDMQIKSYVEKRYPNLLSIPGVGYVTAGLIAGKICDIHRFHSANSLISYSGIDVIVYESGKYKAMNSMPSKKGSKYLRYALFQVSRIIWQHDPVFRAYYEKKQAEGKHYHVILGHIQKKIARAVYSILKNGTTYKTISLT